MKTNKRWHSDARYPGLRWYYNENEDVSVCFRYYDYLKEKRVERVIGTAFDEAYIGKYHNICQSFLSARKLRYRGSAVSYVHFWHDVSEYYEYRSEYE